MHVARDDERDLVAHEERERRVRFADRVRAVGVHAVRRDAVPGERLVHADDDVPGRRQGACLVEIGCEPRELIGAEARLAHVVERDEVDSSRQVHGVDDLVGERARHGSPRRPQEPLAEPAHGARTLEGDEAEHADLVVAEGGVERHRVEPLELLLEGAVEPRRQLHVAEEEERRRLAGLRLAERPGQDMGEVVPRVAADDDAHGPGGEDGRGGRVHRPRRHTGSAGRAAASGQDKHHQRQRSHRRGIYTTSRVE